MLEDEAAVVDVRGTPVRVLGSTLWTDCRLYGRPEFHGRLVERTLNDSRFIRGADGVTDGPGGFTASEAARRHEDSRAFLARELGAPHADPTIVVSHHLASLRGIAARYSDGPVNAGFASNATTSWPWVPRSCGHMHVGHQYRDASGTLVTCNPVGYLRRGGRENPALNPWLVVDIALSKDGTWWSSVSEGDISI